MSKEAKKLSKADVRERVLQHKREILEDFRSEQRSKLAQASTNDQDSRQYESKTEETLHELELLNHNVEILEKEIQLVSNIPLGAKTEEVQYGSLVHTDMGYLLVGAAQEQLEVQGEKVIGLSTAAPLFARMRGKRAGERFSVAGAEHEIYSVS